MWTTITRQQMDMWDKLCSSFFLNSMRKYWRNIVSIIVNEYRVKELNDRVGFVIAFARM